MGNGKSPCAAPRTLTDTCPWWYVPQSRVTMQMQGFRYTTLLSSKPPFRGVAGRPRGFFHMYRYFVQGFHLASGVLPYDQGFPLFLRTPRTDEDPPYPRPETLVKPAKAPGETDPPPPPANKGGGRPSRCLRTMGRGRGGNYRVAGGPREIGDKFVACSALGPRPSCKKPRRH